MTTKFVRITERARGSVRERFNSLMGLVSNGEGLRQSFERQVKDKAPGVDGIKKEEYRVGVEQRIAELSKRVQRLAVATVSGFDILLIAYVPT